MFKYFSEIKSCKGIPALIGAVLMAFVLSLNGYGQSLGDPVVHITFGSGTNQFAGPLKADSGFTDYQYVGFSPNDNQYTIASSTTGLNGGWIYTRDHTGDTNGYMMVVNASYQPGLFYTRRVDGLCPGTSYQFGAFIKNIIGRKGLILPNVTFLIEDITGAFITDLNTDYIAEGDVWRKYATVFKTGIDQSSVVIKMINNAPGGAGNDIAIDDITFQAYGSDFKVALNQADTTFCADNPKVLTLTATTPLEAGFSQKLQQYKNKTWVDAGPSGDNHPYQFTTSTIPGLYVYRLVKAETESISSPGCLVASNVLQIYVLGAPDVKISSPSTACQGETVQFFDATTQPGTEIATWEWDFGDGTPKSSEVNPKHLFTTGGDHTVKLTVTNKQGCTPPGIGTTTIHIIPKVDVAFDLSTPDCETKAVTFTDNSNAPEGTIITRDWNFGDGNVDTKTDSQPFQHIYTKASTYKITLTITTDKGCSYTLSKDVKIGALPVVKFDLPEICYADYFAVFTDKTTISDNSNAGFKYEWDFGDADAGPGNLNTSNLKNPSHHYSKVQQYQVNLTVTTADGCKIGPVVQTLQVNGSPVAGFDVLDNKDALCSNQPVSFKNTAHATIGSITKIVMQYDINDPNSIVVDDDPVPGKIYSHLYPLVSFPQQSKQVTVRMTAYTGNDGVCQAIQDAAITLLPSPDLVFALPGAICLNNGLLDLNALTKESTGIPGTLTFSGKGVTGGFFDPIKAGVGDFDIKCTFTVTGSSCLTELTKQITVKPIPVLEAGRDTAILAGEHVLLQAKATGNGLIYAWYPTTGLTDPAIPNPVATPAANTTYTLIVINDQDCSVTDKVTITVLQPPVIPNAFTPNGDGINDTWNIKYLDAYIDCTVDIFNRNGQKVFTSIGYSPIGWNGRYNNGQLPVGVYYYVINPKHGRKTLSGYVTIIR